MDTALWPQANLDTRHLLNEMGMGMVNPPMERMTSSTRPQLAERRPRPHKEQPLSCPRCQSSNTKFCYYNNYSLSQPRYFCKTCRRYWTEGGSLRNVPVGGGSRKNKRHSATATNSSSSRRSSDILPPPPTSSSLRNPKFPEDKHLHFAFNPAEVSPFMPAAGADYTAAAFGLQDVRSTVEVNYHPLEAITGDRAYGGFQGEAAQENALKRGFFPFEDLRLVSSTATSFEQGRSQEGEASALWNGLMGGGNGSW